MDKLEEYAIQSAFIRNQISETTLIAALRELEDSIRKKFISTLLFGKEEMYLIPKYSKLVIKGYSSSEKQGKIESLKEILQLPRQACIEIAETIGRGQDFSFGTINIDDTSIPVSEASVAQVSIVTQRLKSARFKAILE